MPDAITIEIPVTKEQFWQKTSNQWQQMFETLAYSADVSTTIAPLVRELESLPEGTVSLSRAIQLRKQIREAVLRFC